MGHLNLRISDWYIGNSNLRGAQYTITCYFGHALTHQSKFILLKLKEPVNNERLTILGDKYCIGNLASTRQDLKLRRTVLLYY